MEDYQKMLKNLNLFQELVNTSRSILAIAHNKPYIPMDGNVEEYLKEFLLKQKIKFQKKI